MPDLSWPVDSKPLTKRSNAERSRTRRRRPTVHGSRGNRIERTLTRVATRLGDGPARLRAGPCSARVGSHAPFMPCARIWRAGQSGLREEGTHRTLLHHGRSRHAPHPKAFEQSKFSDEQIVAILAQEALGLMGGAELSLCNGVSRQTLQRWKS